jgi:hypothetical protein
MLIICKPLNSVLILFYFTRLYYFVSQLSKFYSSPLGFSPVTLKIILYCKNTTGSLCQVHKVLFTSFLNFFMCLQGPQFPYFVCRYSLRFVFELNHHLVYTVRSFIRYVHFFYFACSIMYFLWSLLTNTPSSSSLLHAAIQVLQKSISFLPNAQVIDSRHFRSSDDRCESFIWFMVA